MKYIIRDFGHGRVYEYHAPFSQDVLDLIADAIERRFHVEYWF